MNKRIVLILIGISFALKLIYLLLNAAVVEGESSKSLYHQYVSIGMKNDAYWYESIAEKGYSRITEKKDLGYANGADYKQSEWAFFPMYPLTVGGFAKLYGGDYKSSASILSLLFSALALIGIYWFSLLYFKDKQKALFVSLLFLLFPFSFYYSLFYTEAYFFCCMIYAFIAVHYRQYFVLSLCIIPLVLLRPNGIIILLPLYLYYLEHNNLLLRYKFDWKKIFSLKNILISLFFITGPLAFLGYCIYQYKMTGYYNAFSIAQAGWYKEPTFPLLALFRRSNFASQFYSFYTIVALIFAGFSWKKLPLSLNILTWLCLLMPLSGGSVISMGRYISVIFPLFLMLGSLLYKTKYKYPILAVVFSMQLLSFYAWVMEYKVAF